MTPKEHDAAGDLPPSDPVELAESVGYQDGSIVSRTLVMGPQESAETTRRIRRELKTVKLMIEIYCRGQHAAKGDLCPDCQGLWDYTRMRVRRCPFGRDKPTCVNCTVHCFRPEMRDRIRTVMRYAGPKMPMKHPVLSILHVIDGMRPTPTKTKRSRPDG